MILINEITYLRNTKEEVPSSLGNKEFSREIVISLVHDHDVKN